MSPNCLLVRCETPSSYRQERRRELDEAEGFLRKDSRFDYVVDQLKSQMLVQVPKDSRCWTFSGLGCIGDTTSQSGICFEHVLMYCRSLLLSTMRR
jgi:hypothetical protein